MKLKRADGVVVEEGKAYLTLQQAGDTVTGKAGQDGFAERQGRWRHAYFQVRDTSNGSLVSVKLVPRGGELVGQAHLEIEGQKLVGELQFKRD